MRSYKITFAKSINRLIPHYMDGRKLILFLQAILKPLQALNNVFAAWGKQTRIEACMTSQPILFIPYLNNKFKEYFASESDSFEMVGYEAGGMPVFPESNEEDEDALIYDEASVDSAENYDGLILFYEGTDANHTGTYSFYMTSPAVNTAVIKEDEYLSIVKNEIDKYTIGGKTYQLILNEQ